MPSSSVLKRGRERILSFDFDEIRTRVPGAASEEEEDDGGRAESGAAVDPEEAARNQIQAEEERLRQLEEAIRVRLMEAERKAEELEKAAYENGYAQGQKDGFEYGQKSANIVKEHLEQILRGLGALPQKILSDYRQWLLQTCLDISRRFVREGVVREGMASRQDSLMKLIDGLVHEAEPHASLTLYLNPKDYESLKKYTAFQAWMKDLAGALSVRPDPALTAGGACLESDLQHMDATLETQFALLEEAVKSAPQEETDGSEKVDGSEDRGA